jgi:hypothetical protein
MSMNTNGERSPETQQGRRSSTPRAARHWGRRIRIASLGATLAAIALAGALMLSSPPRSSAGDMPGMDMPGMDLPGMDLPGTAHQHGGMAGSAADRPLAPVLGTFGGGTVVVLLTAGLMRRKDRDRLRAREGIRAARGDRR